MKAIVLQGRHGDIVNFLPVAKHIFDTTGEKPFWVVNKLYHSTLLGVNYITPDPVHFSLHKLQHALEYAETKYGKDNVINATAWGKGWKGRRDAAFNFLSWDSVGYGKQFSDTEKFPLVFDNRDLQRESWLAEHHIRGSRRIILTCLGCSKSSPFHHASMLADIISRKWGTSCQIIDLCGVKAARLYDLLGLFEQAACLVTTDTAALHLATAVPSLPVVALVNDNPFLSTQPRCRVFVKLYYREALTGVSQIHNAVFESLKQARERPQIETTLESSAVALPSCNE